MDQLSFSDAEHNCKRKQTKRERFLLEMDHVIPWKRLEEFKVERKRTQAL